MKYDFDLSLDEQTSVGKIISQINENSRVLEFGPGNGRMTNYLIHEKKCEVSIVEFDTVLYDHVMSVAQNGFLGNIEEYKWVDYFAGQKFDYIIFADVLEHLTNSEEALRQARHFLAKDGEILITFPNIAHNSVLIDLFNNKLDWKQYGLLDRTHNSFYTQNGFYDLFNRLDLHVRREDYTYAQVGQNEIETSYDQLPTPVRYSFKNRPFGEVYQYFFALRKEAVTVPERKIPANSNYNKQIQLAYLIADSFEMEPFILNNSNGENKITTHKAPEATESLRIVIGRLPANVKLSVVCENRLLTIKETNANWFKDDIFMFNHISEEPYVTVSGEDIAGKEYTLSVEVIDEEQGSSVDQELFNDLYETKKIQRLLNLKLTYYNEFEYQLSRIPYKRPEEYLQDIRINIETVENNEMDKQVIIKGWGFSLSDQKQLEFLLAEKINDYQVTRLLRPDVNETFTLPLDEKYGFILTIENLQIEDAINLLLVSANYEVFPLVVSMPKETSTPFVKKVRRILGSVKREGVSQAYKNYQYRKSISANYEVWIEKDEIGFKERLLQETQQLDFEPKISLVVPVYNVDEKWLRACVGSLTNQIYKNWELCLADDASPKAHIKPLLQELSATDERIKIVFREQNGHISEATNSAIEVATGEYIGFLDNDDILSETALLEVVKAINEDFNIDFIYTDEDKLSMSGKRFDPFFKSNWNETLLLGHNYITHFVVVKRSIIEKIGGLRTEFNGSQDYDFVLRATEAAQKIHHIPRILYHWRTIETSVAMDPQSKEYAYIAGQKAIEAALERRSLAGQVSMTKNYGAYKVDFTYQKNGKVTIVYTKPLKEKQVLINLLEMTSWQDYEVLLFKENKLATEDKHIRYVDAKNVNELAEAALGEYIVFMAPDEYPSSKNWLNEAMNFIRLPEIGLVSGKVISTQDAILNCGVLIKPNEQTIYYEQQGLSNKTIGTYFRPTLPREIYTTTEDCLIIAKSDFQQLNGFDLALSDQILGVDLSIRVHQELKRKHIFDPYFELICEQTVRFSLPKGVFTELESKYSMNDLEDPYLNSNQFSIGG
ncbi:O-antigen biosynthesis protein [Enterococcus sp. AZ163]